MAMVMLAMWIPLLTAVRANSPENLKTKYRDASQYVHFYLILLSTKVTLQKQCSLCTLLQYVGLPKPKGLM